MKSIQQTKELLAAALSLFAMTAKAKADDGKVSRIEALNIVCQSGGELWTAFAGVGEVPAEIADLDEAEIEELMQATLASQAWADTPRNRAIVESVYASIRTGLQTVRLIIEVDYPAAEPAEEDAPPAPLDPSLETAVR